MVVHRLSCLDCDLMARVPVEDEAEARLVAARHMSGESRTDRAPQACRRFSLERVFVSVLSFGPSWAPGTEDKGPEFYYRHGKSSAGGP